MMVMFGQRVLSFGTEGRVFFDITCWLVLGSAGFADMHIADSTASCMCMYMYCIILPNSSSVKCNAMMEVRHIPGLPTKHEPREYCLLSERLMRLEAKAWKEPLVPPSTQL